VNVPAIQLEGLTRAFGADKAVDALSLTVREGSVFGFLGPNGAGKTTTIRMMVGHLHPTAGAVRTLGIDPWQHDEATRRRVAYVSENMALPGWMTPDAAVRWCAPLYPKWDARLAGLLLDEFALRGKGRFARLSKGQQRSLCIVLALCQNADLIVMDEPASGLDPAARRDFLARVLDVACEEGRTVFFSSHIMSDVERIVDRVGILCAGRLSLEGELDALKRGARRLLFANTLKEGALASAFRVAQEKRMAGRTDAVVLDFDEDRFRAFCAEQGCAEGAQHHGLNLEDLFVAVAGADRDTAGGE
jgi:ABC-2 type transport system ATP-binding protein